MIHFLSLSLSLSFLWLKGTATDANEFYKKNSRWSEGLISAAKQVGWGASMLVYVFIHVYKCTCIHAAVSLVYPQ